jgi:hypothetical protein
MLNDLVGKWMRPALAISASALCACPGGDDAAMDARGGPSVIPEPSAGAGAEVPAPGTFELELLSDGFVQLGFDDNVTLRVQLVDRDGEPVPGGHVGFALVGRVQDSSLARVDALTDADGIAENELMSGEMAAAFKVRITAPGAYETFVEVGVSNSGFGTLQVQAEYTGPRRVVKRVIFAQAETDCDHAEHAPGDPTLTLAPGEDMAQFVALPAQVSYAISAVAEGQDGTIVATGCTDAVVVRRDDRISVRVTFNDEPLLPSGRFALQADLDAAAPAMTLGGALRDGTETLVNTDAQGELVLERAEARFLLDSLDATLRSDDYADAPAAIELADALAQERATPSGAQSPEQSLQTLLSIKDEGALTVVTRIVQLTVADLERLSLLVDLNVVDDAGELSVSWQVERLEALSARGGAPVLIDLSSSEPVPIVASLHPEQDALELTGVRFELPFGALAAQVLDRVVSFDANGEGEALRVLVGCTALTDWLEAQTFAQGGACDEGCVQTTCNHALSRLVSAAEGALTAIDDARPTLVLAGELELGDDDGDLIAEQMSTEMLTGEWEPEAGSDSGDAVFGAATASTLRPAPPTE